MPISAYDSAHGTSSDDVGRVQRDRRAAAPGHPGAAAGGGAAGDRPGPGAGDEPAAGVQAPAGAPGGGAGAGPRGGQAAPLRPGRPRAAAGPRVGRRLRAVLEREFRPTGHLRAGPQADTAGGMTDGTGRARNAGGASDGRPGDRDLPGHRRPTGAGVRGVHRIVMRTVFPTKELRHEAVEKYHAIEGGQQTLSNLAAYVAEIVRQRVED